MPAHSEEGVRGLDAVTRDQMLASLKECAALVEEYAEDYGPCDHSVGLCVCGLYRAVETARDIIAKVEGR